MGSLVGVAGLQSGGRGWPPVWWAWLASSLVGCQVLPCAEASALLVSRAWSRGGWLLTHC